MHTKSRKKVIVAGLATVALMLLALAWYQSTPLFACEDRETDTLPSADGRYVAKILSRNCGATTGLTTILMLQSRSESAAVSDSNRVLALDGACEMSLTWSADTLVVRHAASCDAFGRKSHWRDVHLTYEPAR